MCQEVTRTEERTRIVKMVREACDSGGDTPGRERSEEGRVGSGNVTEVSVQQEV